MHHVKNAVTQGSTDHDHSVGTGTVVKVDGGRVSENRGRLSEGTPCFSRFDRAFSSFHSKSPSMTVATACTNMDYAPYSVKRAFSPLVRLTYRRSAAKVERSEIFVSFKVLLGGARHMSWRWTDSRLGSAWRRSPTWVLEMLESEVSPQKLTLSSWCVG